jgi:hypothetical protein
MKSTDTVHCLIYKYGTTPNPLAKVVLFFFCFSIFLFFFGEQVVCLPGGHCSFFDFFLLFFIFTTPNPLAKVAHVLFLFFVCSFFVLLLFFFCSFFVLFLFFFCCFFF